MTYIKYFFEDKNNKLYYESDDEDEVLDYILDQAKIHFSELFVNNKVSYLQAEIRQILKEKYVNQFKVYDDEEDKQDEEYKYYFDEGFRQYSEYR